MEFKAPNLFRSWDKLNLHLRFTLARTNVMFSFLQACGKLHGKHKRLAQKNAQCGMFWVKSTPSAFHFWGPWQQKNAKAKTCKTTSLKGFVSTAGALLKVHCVKSFEPRVIQIPALHSHSLVHLDSHQLLFGKPQKKKKQELVPMLKRLVVF